MVGCQLSVWKISADAWAVRCERSPISRIWSCFLQKQQPQLENKLLGTYELLRQPILPTVCHHQEMNWASTCCGGDRSLGGGGG